MVEEDFAPSNVALEIRKPLDTSIVKLEVAPRKLFGKPVQTLMVNQLRELERNRKACKCTSKPRRNEKSLEDDIRLSKSHISSNVVSC